MPLETHRDDLRRLAAEHGELLRATAQNQILARIESAEKLSALAGQLAQSHYYLMSVVANDERELEDGCFKIYYLFSHETADLFLTAEYLLAVERATYPSIFPHFPAVDVFEREIRDMFGLAPEGKRRELVQACHWLHAPYPPDLYPLRHDRTTAELKRRVTEYNRVTEHNPAGLHRATPADDMQPPQGGLLLPVGPVHAGIIEPGRFIFHIAGEAIYDLNIYLGYAHKGIERLFQARMTLADGWQLAEQVSGDSSFAHSLAYCLAAETLAKAQVSQEAQLLRGLFLELERIYNHVGDISALAHDVALELLASELAVVREELLRMNNVLAGNRFLRGLNRPGGVVVPRPLDSRLIRVTLDACLKHLTRLAEKLAGLTGFRDRAIGTGILTAADALSVGATGLAARASGIARDYRRTHPSGIYTQDWMQQGLDDAYLPGTRYGAEAAAGDVYARFLVRVQEIAASVQLVRGILERWTESGEIDFCQPVRFDPVNNYTFAIGYAEGWRGDIVYWLMQDKLGRIYRCKVRDPSMLNWPALRLAIIPHEVAGKQVETILPDFPLINKSFNLSYSGNDL